MVRAVKYNPDIHHRRSIRLKAFDYSQNGAYFITVCTQDRANLFGEVVVGADLVSAHMQLSNAGKMVEDVLIKTIGSFDVLDLNKYIIMPNHIHCVIFIYGADTRSAPTRTVSETIQAFKSITTVEYINGVKSGLYPPFNRRIWQRNYYDRIIRDEDEYRRVCLYIDENPAEWTKDEYFV